MREETLCHLSLLAIKDLCFSANDDRSIDNGFALQLFLGISRIQEHETDAKRKLNVQFIRQSSSFRELFAVC